ncbi:F0F1 ATP synthase subunit delta [Cytobacillus suaedae]|nr:F0F1 ATP synthase subunit delta [Cytobacillus suaedae]
MSIGIVAKRYAVALFQIANEQNALDQFEGELRTVKQVFSENPELFAVLQNPKLALDRKKGMISAAFTGLSTSVLNTLMILLDRHRINIVIDMVEDFIKIANEARGIEDAKVYSVRPLTEDEKNTISSSFAAKVGKSALRIENIVDKALIGGVKLRIGNRIYDGSVSGKLARLERELIAKRS